jgi:FKBP-type peptidyl-prolyl cis-trans isomerase FklB
MDTTMKADFVRGLREGARSANDPKLNAYVIGLGVAREINERMLPGITEEFKDSPDSIVGDLLYKGFIAAIEGDTTVFTYNVAEKLFTQKRAVDKIAKENKLYGPNREAGEKFMKENAKNDSVIVLPSGLQYKVLVKGDGEVPLENQKVQVNYEGRLIDGTVFDASSKHGDAPAEFTPKQVIKGWTEALTMMPVGSKWQLYIPYYLAYGERSAGEIKPFSALIFDVELVGIVKN